MRYRLLGNSGLRVSEAALGALTFGEESGWGSPKDVSVGPSTFPPSGGRSRKTWSELSIDK
jgi:hypothetical protein